MRVLSVRVESEAGMTESDELRRNADECRRMADNTRNSEDKASWLRLAESWLRMLKGEQKRAEPSAASHWPQPHSSDSQSSH